MFKFFHFCRHRKPNSATRGEIKKKIIRNNGSEVDVIIEGASVSDIVEVRAIEYKEVVKRNDLQYDSGVDVTYDDEDEVDGYYDEGNPQNVDYAVFFEENEVLSNALPSSFYDGFLHNRIKWNVNPPDTYEVSFRAVFKSDQYSSYNPKDCPICQGKSWFVDITDDYTQFSKDQGIEKIVQRILKDILTNLYSNVLKLEYGTLLTQRINTHTGDDEKLFDDIRLIISEVEDRYLVRQAEEIATLPDDEILVSLSCENVYRSLNTVGIAAELLIQTRTETSRFRFSF